MTLAATPSDRWSIVRGLFEAVSALADAQRKSFLDFACPDEGIRAQVESMLHADRSAEAWEMPADRSERVGEDPLPQIPGYRVERLVATGGAGSVYAAIGAGGRRVAIKVMRSSGSGSQSVLRFRQECRALARLSHPGVVQLIETGEAAGGVIYLVMEFLQGLPLDGWVRDEAPSVERSITLVLRMLDALAHAHDAGVIHRDIKPHNVVVLRGDEPKLVDFGVARLVSDEGRRTGFRTETGHLVGTFAYMSPEQADGRSERIGVPSDVYQSALLLFEMIAGRLPYETDGRSAAGLLRAVLMDRRLRLDEVRPEVPTALADLLDRALAIEPERRPQTVRAFAEELRALACANA